jgi:FeS assembly SUF system protein
MVTMEDIMKALKECYDPEIPVNVWDLGLIYDVKVDGEKVNVKMTLTAPGCPMHSYIAREVKEKLQSVNGVKEANVEVVWDPPWSPDRISPEAKVQLGIE